MPAADRYLVAAFSLALCAGAAAVATSIFAIEPLLPAESKANCFAATFDGSTPLLLGWSHETPVAAPITSMQVRIELPPGQERYRDEGTGYRFDWRYETYVSLQIKGRPETYTAPTSCDWRQHALDSIAPWLGCFIDCDGGGIGITRVPGRRAIDVVWEASNHLRMSECSGGGVILRAGKETKTFRLTKLAEKDCEPVKER